MYNYDFIVQLLVTGDSGVGKSNILRRLDYQGFLQTRDAATDHRTYTSRSIELENQTVRLGIWENKANPVRFLEMKRNMYGSNGFILVYDITNRETYTNAITHRLQEIQENSSGKKYIALVGNKSDLAKKRAVTAEEAEAFASQHNMSFTETSALDNSNVREVFERLLISFLRNKAGAAHPNGALTVLPQSAIIPPPTPVVQKIKGSAFDSGESDNQVEVQLPLAGDIVKPDPSPPPPDFDDEGLDFPHISDWLKSLDKSKRGRDGQKFVQYAPTLEAAGYTRIDSLHNPAHVTSKKLVDLTGMLPGHADNILKWVVTDIYKLRKTAEKLKLEYEEHGIICL